MPLKLESFAVFSLVVKGNHEYRYRKKAGLTSCQEAIDWACQWLDPGEEIMVLEIFSSRRYWFCTRRLPEGA